MSFIDTLGGIRNLSPGPDIAFQYQENGEPWPSVAAAHLGVPEAYHAVGKIRFIDLNDGKGMVEYWYKDGIDMQHLVPRYENLETAQAFMDELNQIKDSTQQLMQDTMNAATGVLTGNGTYNAATNQAHQEASGADPAATFTPTDVSDKPKGYFLYVTVAGEQEITGETQAFAVGGRLRSQGPGLPWQYWPPSDESLMRVQQIEQRFREKNLFNPALATDGFYVGSSGENQASALYGVTGMIPVSPGEVFTGSDGVNATPIRTYGWYNAAQAFISSVQTPGATTNAAPAGAAFIKASYYQTGKGKFQLERGSVATGYVPYGGSELLNVVLDSDNVREKPTKRMVSDALINSWNAKIAPADLTVEIGKNKFDKSQTTDGFVIGTNNSAPAANASYYYTPLIPVSAAKSYSFWSKVASRGVRRIRWYSSASVFISSLDSSNGSTRVFDSPSNAAYVQFSGWLAEKDSFQMEEGIESTDYDAYYWRVTGIRGNIIKPKAGELVQDRENRLVTDQMISDWDQKIDRGTAILKQTKNLFDPQWAQDGVFVNSTGSLSASGNYFVTGYIPANPGDVFSGSDKGAHATAIRSHGWYTFDLTPISNSQTAVQTTGAAPVNTAYIRATGHLANKADFMLEEAPAPTLPWEPFGFTIAEIAGGRIVPDIENIPVDENHRFVTDEQIASWNSKADGNPNIVLPSRLYAVVGKEFNLYYDAFTLLPEYGAGQPNFLFDIVCSKGAIGYRSFRFTPAAGDVGTYPFTFNLLNSSGAVVQTATSTLVVVAASNPAAPKRILDFGDSTVDEGTTTKTLQENLAAMGGSVPTFHGQHHPAPYKNEARTGRTFAAFAGVGSTAYKVYLTGLNPAMNISNIRYAIYSSGSSSNLILLSERWKINPDGTGWAIGYYFSTFTPPAVFPATFNAAGSGSSGAVANGFPATLTVTSVETLNNFSIFKDNEGVGALNIGYYREQVLGMAPADKFDLARIDLGINDVGSTIQSDAQITTIVNNAKALIAAFLADNAACKIVVSLPKSRASDYYVTSRKQSNFRVSIHKLRKRLIAEFDFNAAYPNVFISQSGYGIDRFYGYPNSAQAAGARLSASFQATTDDVHPNTGGYQQVGDALTGCVLYALKQ